MTFYYNPRLDFIGELQDDNIMLRISECEFMILTNEWELL